MFAPCRPPRLFVDNCLAAGLCIIAKAHTGAFDGLIPSLWFFGLQPEGFGERAGDLVVDICEEELFGAFARHYGLDATWARYETGTLGPAIEAELDAGRPVGVMIDTGQCPWSPKYRKDVSEHMLVVDRRLDTGLFRSVDTISDRPEAIALDAIRATFRTNPKISGKLLRVAPAGQTTPWFAPDGIYGTGRFAARRSGMAAAIRGFAARLREADPGVERGRFRSETAVPIYYRPAFLSNGRAALAETLKARCDDGRALAEEIAALGAAWTRVRAQIMVICERRKGTFGTVADQIDRLADREAAAVARMSDRMGWE